METKNINMKIVTDILNSREIRANKQKDLLKIYPCTLISFTLNTPGVVKNSNLYRKIHNEGMKCILEVLRDIKNPILNILTNDNSSGNEGFISINANPIQIKEITIRIEDTHPLGRIFDFDVFDSEQNQISRSRLGFKSRRCLICEEIALVCMKTKKHSYEELINKVEEVGTKYFE